MGFPGGIFAWLVTNFIAQPFISVWNARAEAARVLAMFEQFDISDPDRGEFPPDLVIDRRRALQAAGAQLAAFDLSYQMLVPLLRRFRIRPRDAGSSLMLLADMPDGGIGNDEVRNQIMRALRLGRKFGRVRI
jgi:hypothetical protein